MPVTRTSGSTAGITGSQIKDNTIQGRDVDESTLSLSFIVDEDGNTKIQCEEGDNENKIRFDTSGSERAIIDESGNFGVGTSNPKCVLDVHMKSSYFNNLVNDNGGGEVVQFGSATGLSAGALYYLDGNGTWVVADADSVASGERLVAIALGGSAASGMLVDGYFDAHTKLSNFIRGKVVYISNSSGFMDTAAPDGTGDIVRAVGYCTDTPKVIRFSPDKTWIEL